MPSIKDLICSIELPETKHSLPEYGTIWGDGCVETFVAVPSGPKQFAIHLRSNAYIAEGLAMYVFIDGVYQCNRLRQGLQDRRPSGEPLDRRTLIDFLVRQKEDLQPGGAMIAREWSFEKLNIVSADDAPKTCSPDRLDNIGCIEVVVLRCKDSRRSRPKPQIAGFDGTADIPGAYLGMDGQSRQSPGSDLWHQLREQDRYNPAPRYSATPSTERASPRYAVRYPHSGGREPHHPSRPSTMIGPPPPLSYVSYKDQGARSAAHAYKVPSEAFEYGTGPIPHHGHPRAESDVDLFRNRTPTHTPGEDLVSPDWLRSVTEQAYKRGMEEAMRKAATAPAEHLGTNMAEPTPPPAFSVPPGDWPQHLPDHAKSPWESTQSGDRVDKETQHVSWPHSTWESGSSYDTWSNASTARPKSRHTSHDRNKGKDKTNSAVPESTWPWDDRIHDEISPSWTSPPRAKHTKYAGKFRERSQSQRHGRNSKTEDPWISDSPHLSTAGSHHRSARHRSRSHAAPTVHTVASNTGWGEPEKDDSWETSASDWTTTSSVISPREALTYSQRHSVASPTWSEVRSPPWNTGAENASAVTGKHGTAGESSTWDSWPPSASQAAAKHQHGSTSRKKRSEAKDSYELPPIPIPLGGYIPGKHPMSPPPPYSMTTLDILRSTGRRASAAPVCAPSWNTTKVDDSGWVTVDEKKKESKSLRAKDTRWSTAEDQASSGTWTADDKETKPNDGWATTPPPAMPGAWDTGDEVKEKQSTLSIWETENAWTPNNAKANHWPNGPSASTAEGQPVWNFDAATPDWGSVHGNKEPEKEKNNEWNAGGDASPAWSGDEQADTANKPNAEKGNVNAGGWTSDANDDAAWPSTDAANWTNNSEEAKEKEGDKTAEQPSWDKTDAKSKADEAQTSAWGWTDGNVAPGDAKESKVEETQESGWPQPDWGDAANDEKKTAGDASANAGTSEKKAESAKQTGEAGKRPDWNNDAWGNNEATPEQPTQANTQAAWNEPAWGDTAAPDADKKSEKKGETPAADGWNNNNDDDAWGNNDKAGGNNNDAWATNDDANKPKSDRHSTTSRKPHPYPKPPSLAVPQPYWAFPPPAPSTVNNNKVPSIPAPSVLPPIPESTAKTKGVEHAVHPGKGRRYTHSVARPEYVDSLRKPYAVFRFKYRSEDYLKGLLGPGFKVDGEVGEKEKNKEEETREWLKSLGEEDVIKEVMRLKGLVGSKQVNEGGWGNDAGEAEKKAEGENAHAAVGDFVQQWVGDQQARTASKRSDQGKSEKAKSCERGE
ncbi:hypothetical protein M011DRAFT_191425 [Sporormia fimetaria CBS 119925]|uniref:DUF7918 domain-containing protein n=1 Tax=Sporormia fimetaria CBS 119925 TaxID=1340428 RepID=A0A6A6VMK0_9PLEO|nr:hypothetical protein M011DRAFT_191425 [Sporormia fimetaria CBS 119925]